MINQLLPNQPSQSSESLNSTRNRTATLLTGKPPASLPDNSVDRKFNLVIYGVKEHPKGTDRRARSKSDIDNCVRILKQADNDINIQSVRDCVRLGKFNSSNTRPRPLLVKLTRIPDVDSVLYNRSNITEGILVKPDMSRDERHKESILLKERWSLTQSGVDKKHIKNTWHQRTVFTVKLLILSLWQKVKLMYRIFLTTILPCNSELIPPQIQTD